MTPSQFRFIISAMGLAVCLCSPISGCGKNAATNSARTTSSPEVAELTRQVRRYAFEKRKLPQNVEDLVAAGYIKSVPPAPAGKKYAIDTDRAEVVLANQ